MLLILPLRGGGGGLGLTELIPESPSLSLSLVIYSFGIVIDKLRYSKTITVVVFAIQFAILTYAKMTTCRNDIIRSTRSGLDIPDVD